MAFALSFKRFFRPSFALPIFFGACALIYLFAIRAYPVGWFNDDAFFIIGARSLLQGTYSELNAPGHPPLINYMPGYPLLLAPLAALFKTSFLPMQFLSILLTLGSLFLFWKMTVSESVSVRLPVLLASAFNPLTVSLSGTVLSDVAYLFMTMAFLYAVKSNWQKNNRALWIFIFSLGVCAYYVRVAGALLILSLLIVLILEKRWRRVFQGLMLSTALILPFYFRNWIAKGIGSWYLFEFLNPYSRGAAFRDLWEAVLWQFSFYPRELFVRYLFRWPWNVSHEVAFITVLAGVLLIGLAFFQRKMSSFAKVVLIYLALYALVHVLWHKQASRYFLPVLPFVYYGFFKGADDFSKICHLRFSVAWLAIMVALLTFVMPLKNIVATSLLQNNPVFALPDQTFHWVRESTPPAAVFAAELDGQFYLLTHRSTVHFRNDLSPQQFAAWVRQANADYVFVRSADGVLKTRSQNTAHDPLSEEFLNRGLDPRFFEVAYENQQEKTKVVRWRNR